MIFKVVAAVVALALPVISPSSQVYAEEEARVHITFSKPGFDNASGYLFYQGQKYRLAVSGTKVGRIWVTSLDFIGTVSSLHSPADILGTYNTGDPKAAVVGSASMARLENAKGVNLEIRAVNLKRGSTLDLFGMKLKNVGWQPTSE
jgi:hypothetical protein